eukprot:3308829-Rhodomonas_salina.2
MGLNIPEYFEYFGCENRARKWRLFPTGSIPPYMLRYQFATKFAELSYMIVVLTKGMLLRTCEMSGTEIGYGMG